MKKFLLVVFTILTFGLFLVPCCFASGYNMDTLDNTNKIIDVSYTQSTYWQTDIRTDIDNTLSSRYVLLQAFQDVKSPYNISSLVQSVTIYYNSSGGTLSSYSMSSYTSNSNYGYRYNTLFDTTSIRFIRIVWLASVTQELRESFVFNVTFSLSPTGFIGSFVPNSFYGIEGVDYYGYFIDNVVQIGIPTGTTSIIWSDITQDAKSFNRIGLNNRAQEVYNNNNLNGYQYFMQVSINKRLSDMSNLSFSFLELSSIQVNGQWYDYTTAKNTFNWLGQNIVLYDDNATFIRDMNSVRNNNAVIGSIKLRLPDYTWKSSSYFNSSIGLLGYLERCQITLYQYDTNYVYDMGFDSGYSLGEQNGYNNGYNDGVATHQTSFGNLMFSIADVPVHIISGMLDFEILGVNLLGFFMGIITLMLFVYIIRKFKE